MKYQFCIRFDNIDANSAASKAVLDCNKIFRENGYRDHTITVGDNKNKGAYYLLLAKQLIAFFFSIKAGAIVGIQYPLLSINNIFRHFIKVARSKGVRFFCIVHDLESLRTGGKDQLMITREVDNLNRFDMLIVHNDKMLEWLQNAGVAVQMMSLGLFDYLTPRFESNIGPDSFEKSIVYAGNLTKSRFIYDLHKVNRSFKLYGPGFDMEMLSPGASNVTWSGVFSPDEIVKKMDGSFGLIWDGSDIDKCDEVLGNYLKYNNPHKCSLYIAAGLPVIAPANSAVGDLILRHNIGLVINSLSDLDTLILTEHNYRRMLSNIAQIRAKVCEGRFFTKAIQQVELELV